MTANVTLIHGCGGGVTVSGAAGRHLWLIRPTRAGSLLALISGMRSALIFALALASGCVAYVHSPSGRSFPLESSKTLYKRETGMQVEAGGGLEAGVGLPGFNVRVRHGIVDKLDGSAEFGYQRIRTEDFHLATSDRNIFTGRLGIKYAMIDHIALTAGLAAGGWAGGSFLSPDLSMIFAYENPYCVPFVDAGGYTSHPLRTSDVVITDLTPGGLGDDSLTAAPVFTYGWTVGFGLRIPLLHYDKHKRVTPPSILLGMRFRGVYYDPLYNDFGRNGRLYWYGSVGFEYIFAPRRTQQN